MTPDFLEQDPASAGFKLRGQRQATSSPIVSYRIAVFASAMSLSSTRF
ncbi:hypothetical protein PENANT_c025G11643 [Penicillium antarcticum]|uniref:Uncharacterized protein n=1 Tax=Penicillium antarcticum TaxID=416450 RepID=A0A1V6PY97_9EURO|nr:hypothetical protein PENANT_c025G11643 [Penicillium antarcticum]